MNENPESLDEELDDVRAQVGLLPGRVVAWACVVLVENDDETLHVVESVARSPGAGRLLGDELIEVAKRARLDP